MRTNMFEQVASRGRQVHRRMRCVLLLGPMSARGTASRFLVAFAVVLCCTLLRLCLAAGRSFYPARLSGECQAFSRLYAAAALLRRRLLLERRIGDRPGLIGNHRWTTGGR